MSRATAPRYFSKLVAKSRGFARGELPPSVAREGNKSHLFAETARDHGRPQRPKTPADIVGVEDKEHGQRLVCRIASAYASPILLSDAARSQERSTRFPFFWRETQNRAPRLGEQLKSLAGGGRGEPGRIANRGAACEDVEYVPKSHKLNNLRQPAPGKS